MADACSCYDVVRQLLVYTNAVTHKPELMQPVLKEGSCEKCVSVILRKILTLTLFKAVCDPTKLNGGGVAEWNDCFSYDCFWRREKVITKGERDHCR